MNVKTTRIPGHDPAIPPRPTDPTFLAVVSALVMSLVLVFVTRLPVARPWPMETDEFGFLDQIRVHWFPMHHTLFMTAGRLLGCFGRRVPRALGARHGDECTGARESLVVAVRARHTGVGSGWCACGGNRAQSSGAMERWPAITPPSLPWARSCWGLPAGRGRTRSPGIPPPPPSCWPWALAIGRISEPFGSPSFL